MSTSYKTSRKIEKPTLTSKVGEDTIVYGKVSKVYHGTGNPLLEGAIQFSSNTKRSLPNIAYPINFGTQQLPLLGEMVSLYYNETLEKVFYGPSVNIHNFPTHNSPDAIVQESTDYYEPSDINSYALYAGDTIMQGRFGQSIRFSQSIPNKTPWNGEQGKAAVLISSGQIPTEDGSSLLVEDINRDPSSLYLIEEASINLTDNSKRSSYEEAPQRGRDYLGNQAILASNRVYINAREESILASAQSGSIGLSGNTVNLDGVSSIRLDAPTYNLQADTHTTTNQTRTIDSETSTYNYTQFDLTGTNININHSRIGLGSEAVNPLLQSPEFLTDLAALNVQLTTLSTALTGVTVLLAALPGGQAPAAALQTASTNLITQANSINTKIGSGTYLSTTVFTK